MEGRLRATEDRFRFLVEGITDYALVLLDPEGRVASWNPGAEGICGHSQAEILGQPFVCMFGDEGLEDMLPQAVRHGRVEQEVSWVRRDQSRLWVNVILTCLQDPKRGVRGFALAARDITEQRATQAAFQSQAESLEDKIKAHVEKLHLSEARLEGFVRHASAAIAFKGVDGRWLLINPKMETMVGRPSQEILGRTNDELFPPDLSAEVNERDQRVIREGVESMTEVPFTHPDGTDHIYLAHRFPLLDASGQCWGLGIISTDITEHKLAALNLLQSQKLESLGVLAGGIAHDFNNLLGAMQGNVELALAEASPDPVKAYLETLKGLMSKASDLLRQMLAYAGQGKSRVSTFDLNQLVVEMTQLLGTSISKKGVIHLDLHPGALPMEADPSQIQQVIMNLVINASEALGEHNGVITIRTWPEMITQGVLDGLEEGKPLQSGLYVCLEVSDNGTGMSREVLKRIFDPFFTTKFTGRGLGLAALHGIVRGHQGGIHVRSEAGQGSTFKLLFPASRGLAVPVVPEERLPARATGQDGAQGTVLVVDDEDAMRKVVVKALTRVGFETLEARDGLEALSVVQEQQGRIGLILMDLLMPNMDGEEACRELRRRGVAVPVILSSGFNEADAMRRFEGLGLAGFVQKPFSLGALVELARRELLG